MSDLNSSPAPRPEDNARPDGESTPQPDEPQVPNEPEPGPATPSEPNPPTPDEPSPTAPETPTPEPVAPGFPGAPEPAPTTPQPSPSSPEPDGPSPLDPGVPAASSQAPDAARAPAGSAAPGDFDAPDVTESREDREAATAAAIARNSGSDSAEPRDAEAAHEHRMTDAYDEPPVSEEHRLTASEPATESAETRRYDAATTGYEQTPDTVSDDDTDTVRHEPTPDETPTYVATAAPAGAEPTERDAEAGGTAQYVQAPEAPVRKGNRGFGILISVLQAIIFAAIFYGVLLLIDYLAGKSLDYAAIALSPMFLITVAMFFIGLVIVALLANRAGWAVWILLGLLVAAFAYVGAIGGSLAQDAMSVPSNRVWQYIVDHLLTWPTVVAFVLGREIPIWFGAWIARRGRRVHERNIAEHDEYQRQLDEGPFARG